APTRQMNLDYVVGADLSYSQPIMQIDKINRPPEQGRRGRPQGSPWGLYTHVCILLSICMIGQSGIADRRGFAPINRL
ncbi:MAG TPA: hypothetical protein VGT44_08165, partial [Ktedonobacteraceae bacterium]|nr:hypothetical protein [Ktedonobacteraceae bacterium]